MNYEIIINETIVKEGSIMKSKLKNFSLLTISTLIMAVGIYFFKFANNFTFGGITGIAVLVAKFLPISASDFSFVVNILLLIIGWIVLGKSFAEKTAYSTILLSVSLSLLERIYPMRQYVMTPKFVGSWIYLYTMNWKLTMVTGITAYKLEVII